MAPFFKTSTHVFKTSFLLKTGAILFLLHMNVSKIGDSKFALVTIVSGIISVSCVSCVARFIELGVELGIVLLPGLKLEICYV